MVIILHNVYVCIRRQLLDHLPGGKYHNASDTIRNETASCPTDNVAAERVFAGLDFLKRNKPNMSVLAMQGILLWTQNRSMDYLDKCSEEDRQRLINQATKRRKSVVMSYQEKVKTIRQKQQALMDSNHRSREERKRKQVASTIAATEKVQKFGGPCQVPGDVDTMIEKISDTKLRRQALVAQLDYYKAINGGLAKGALFFKTKAGKQLDDEQLCQNLKEAISHIHQPQTMDEEQAPSSMVCEDKNQKRQELKATLLAKLNTCKRKLPFPEDSTVTKRIN